MIRQFGIVLLVCLMIVIAFDLRAEVVESENSGAPGEFLARLKQVGGVNIRELKPKAPFKKSYVITFYQPLDHENPGSALFKQKIVLSHIDENRPMVFVPTGYGLTGNFVMEVSKMLNANQLIVPHRFFKGAEPEQMNWRYLTPKQAAADNHNLIRIFKKIYKGKWVGVSRSSGARDALVIHHLYPGDLDAVVAYVAPFTIKPGAPEVLQYLDNEIGSLQCRQKVKAFQRLVLSKRAQILPYIQKFAEKNKCTFSLGNEAVLEYAVLEYMFSFWQYNGKCDSIPTVDASIDEVVEHIQKNASFEWYSDHSIKEYWPSFYLSYTGSGYYDYITGHLQGLLSAVPKPTNAVFAPQGVALKYNASLMEETLHWLENQGHNVIYIYGVKDPWTAGAVKPSSETNALKIISPTGNHSIRIKDLTEAQQVQIQSLLKQWLNL